MKTEYCELCGAPITKGAHLVQIEGSKPMKVCDNCAKHGTEVAGPKPKQTSFGARPSSRPAYTAQRQGAPIQPRKRDMFDYIEGDIVEDYPKRIADARKAKGYTQNDLAFVLKMQEGDIKKFERGERAPTEAERKKLEAELGIELLDAGDSEEKVQKGGVAATTLGDVIQVKRK